MAHAIDLMMPRILVVDDERQIHASLRLRLGHDYELAFCFDAREALERLRAERFDLCFADIHMPRMDGLTFIAAAQEIDPAVEFVVISAFDTDENLRRAIPLRVGEFVSKPLPERADFEEKIPAWIARARERRHRRALAAEAADLNSVLDATRLERDVEIVASETARDALSQTASLLTTIHAHLVTATIAVSSRGRGDPALATLLRNLEEARKTADAAVAVAHGFFDSAYGNRESSPALLESGVRHALGIAARATRAEPAEKSFDLIGADDRTAIRDLSGIDFLLLLVPAFAAAFVATPPRTTMRVEAEFVPRLEAPLRDARFRQHLWVNRRGAAAGQAAVLLSVTTSGPALVRAEAEAWLTGRAAAAPEISASGLVRGMQKCRGALAFGVAPSAAHFSLVLALPLSA